MEGKGTPRLRTRGERVGGCFRDLPLPEITGCWYKRGAWGKAPPTWGTHQSGCGPRAHELNPDSHLGALTHRRPPSLPPLEHPEHCTRAPPVSATELTEMLTQHLHPSANTHLLRVCKMSADFCKHCLQLFFFLQTIFTNFFFFPPKKPGKCP